MRQGQALGSRMRGGPRFRVDAQDGVTRSARAGDVVGGARSRANLQQGSCGGRGSGERDGGKRFRRIQQGRISIATPLRAQQHSSDAEKHNGKYVDGHEGFFLDEHHPALAHPSTEFLFSHEKQSMYVGGVLIVNCWTK